MSAQPPVQPPDQPSNPPTPPTQPMSAAESGPPTAPASPAAGPPAPAGPSAGPAAGPAAGPPPGPPTGPATFTASGEAPRPSMWRRATSTRNGRVGLAIAAAALAFLMILGVGIAGVALLRHGDRINLLGDRSDAYSRGDDGPGNGKGNGNGRGNGNRLRDGKVPNGNGRQYAPEMPGMPGGRDLGLGRLGNVLGGTALHGSVTTSSNGTVQALLFQRGEVTAVSGTSITLKSSDGFTGTYGRTAETISRGATPVKGGKAIVLARASDKVAITIMATRDLSGAGPSS